VRSCLGRAVKLGVLAALVLLLLGLVTHPGRVALATAGLLVEVFPEAPVYPLRLATEPPARSEVRFRVGGRETVADLYRPAGAGPHGALLFYVGVGPERRNVHLVRLAEGLARTGVVVLVPVSPEMSRFRIVPEEEEWVIGAFRFLRGVDTVDPDRIGIMGISAGGGVVAVAAADPRLRDEVRLLELFGSYYSAGGMIEAATTRTITVDGERIPWTPQRVTLDVLRNMLLPTVPEADRAALAPLFAGEQTRVPSGLSPQGRSLARVLVNRDPARAPALIAQLPTRTRALMAGVSPAAEIGNLRTEVFLLHDVDDAIVPFTESRAFHAAATSTRDRHLTELTLFQHVEPTAGDNPLVLLREIAELYGHVYRVMLRLA
jgi:dienelactone hydrolase